MKLFAAIQSFMDKQQGGWWTQFSVSFNETGFTVTELCRKKPQIVQSTAWSDIHCVCFKDGGIGSDCFFVFVREQSEPLMVPISASGGLEFWNELKERALFPPEISGQCVQSVVTGAEFWWPPEMSANNSFNPMPLRGTG